LCQSQPQPANFQLYDKINAFGLRQKGGCPLAPQPRQGRHICRGQRPRRASPLSPSGERVRVRGRAPQSTNLAPSETMPLLRRFKFPLNIIYQSAAPTALKAPIYFMAAAAVARAAAAVRRAFGTRARFPKKTAQWSPQKKSGMNSTRSS
jgi:hypothetical protein